VFARVSGKEVRIKGCGGNGALMYLLYDTAKFAGGFNQRYGMRIEW
jgi:hypothetical protein